MYFVTFSLYAAKKDIVSFAKLKSINPVIKNLNTIPKQKFPNSRERPYILEESYQVAAK